MAPGQKTSMEYVRLGNSGLKVSKIILGCMSCDAGINTFDTANMYSNGESERILGGAIKEFNLPREEIVVLTKVYFSVKKDNKTAATAAPNWNDKNGYVNQHGVSRKHIFDSVKASLERLQLDDVLQCHRFDYNTPIEETMQALHDVVKAGYVRYIGMSSCHAYQFAQMQIDPLHLHGKPLQPLYREEEREMFPTLQLFGADAIPWSPLAQGLLTRPRDAEKTARSQTDIYTKGYGDNEGTRMIISSVEQIAKKYGVTMAQVSLARVMSRPGVTAPIVGTTSSLDNLKDLLGAVHVKLTDEDKKELEEAYQPRGLFGHT
ncbi:hypothetical protein EST38_g4272 [Candolleomyces aberdarensis]|uniref:NADP-dependent oxidoreductase domain-containing protein n=1 Tax=Candolleomyces aberdarensis TaxID=2316362 RepID=A0A4Q2DN19_9AGAR|nr:hypothetical protein EST38_g4272 [Candolleomyces aberdarensis]